MSFEELTNKFHEKEYLLEMGAGKLSKMFKTTKEQIKEIKAAVRAERAVNAKGSAKILILDIETAPIKARVWGIWNQNVLIQNIISDWFMLTWSAKWLFDTKMHSDKLTSKEAINEDDSRIVNSIGDLLEEADIVVAHYGDKFDLPKIRARMLVNNLLPVSPYRQIDTKKIASKEFGFTSNKLDALAGLFGIEHKIETTMQLWIDCVNGKNDALKQMEVYNRKDVDILEKVYLRLRPWIKSHPNVSMPMESDKTVCPVCGSEELTENGYYYTGVNRFKTYQCVACGSPSRERKGDFPKDKKQSLLVSIAR